MLSDGWRSCLRKTCPSRLAWLLAWFWGWMMDDIDKWFFFYDNMAGVNLICVAEATGLGVFALFFFNLSQQSWFWALFVTSPPPPPPPRTCFDVGTVFSASPTQRRRSLLRILAARFCSFFRGEWTCPPPPHTHTNKVGHLYCMLGRHAESCVHSKANDWVNSYYTIIQNLL